MVRRSRGLIAAAAGAAGLFFAQGAQASTYCVNFATGECSGVQKANIKPALTAADNHAGRDTVKIAGGHGYVQAPLTYDGSDPVDIVGTSVAGDQPQLSTNGSHATVLTVASPGSTVSNLGFDLSGTNNHGLSFEGATASEVKVEATGALSGVLGVDLFSGTLSDSTVSVSHTSTDATFAVQVEDDARVVHSTLSAGTGVSIPCTCSVDMKRDQITAARGINAPEGGDETLVDSVVVSNGKTQTGTSLGLRISDNVGGAATFAIEGSTIYNKGSGVTGVQAMQTTSGTESVVLHNSIVRNFTGDDLEADGAGASITGDYNDVGLTVPTSGATITPGAHDQNVAPGFADAAGGDFHLASTSPLIDIGDPAGLVPGEPATDVFGAPRLITAHGHVACPVRDIGAAEFKPTPLLDPYANFTTLPAATFQVGDPISFDASASCARSSSLHVSDYSWEFGDGFGDSGVQVTHTYQLPGMHTVILSVVDSAGHTGTASRTLDVQPGPPPSHHFDFGKPKRDRKKGTAKLPVKLPGPGKLKLEGKGLVKQSKAAPRSIHVDEAGTVKLLVKAKNNKKHKLKKHGKVAVKAEVTFTPTGGTAKTKTKTLTLKRKH